jgi:RNA recognition motif-containing protein
MSSNLVDEYDSDQDSDQGSDQAGVLLQGFDNDSEDLAQDEGFDKDKPTAAIPNYKKTQKKLTQAAQKGNKDGPGTVYVGRIPHGFYENEMRQYFSQFGTITKLRLSRNRKTGHSKHFAFMEFESSHVAKIVAETMDNYLMFGHILKCKYVPPQSLHPETFKGANKRFRVAPHNKMEKRALEAPKSESHWTKKNSKEQTKREKKAEKLKAMGYDIELPKLKNPTDVLQQRESQTAEEEKAPDTAEADGKDAVPAGTAVSSDEVAPSKRKTRKRKAGPHLVQPEDGATSTLNTVPNDELAVSKKSKKEKAGPSSAEAEGEDGSTLHAVSSHEVAMSKKKSKKEKKGTDIAVAEGKDVSTLDAVAGDELAPTKKKSKKEKKGTSSAGEESKHVSTLNTAPSDEVVLSKKKSKKDKKAPTSTGAEGKDFSTLDEKKRSDPAAADRMDGLVSNAVSSHDVALGKKKSKKDKKGPTAAGAEGKDRLALDEKKTPDAVAARGNDVSTTNAVASDVSLIKKPQKEKKRTDVSEADGKETQVPAAVAKDELAPSKKKSRKEKKEKTVTAEMNGVTVPTADSNTHISDPIQYQNGVKGSSEKRDKRKEQREKSKDEAKQLPPMLVGDENAPTVNGKSPKPDSHATVPASDPTKAGQSSEHKKKKKEKAKGESAPVATTETAVIATANADIASAEGPLSSIVPVEYSKGDKGARKNRKRKGVDTGNEMAEAEPKAAQPLGTDATEAVEAKSMRKKTKKA